VLSHPRFQDEQAAYDWVEAHLWPDGPVCPRCGGLDRITKLQGKSTRIGTYKCKDCRKPFTVKVGTIFEDSHIPMRMWLQAIALLCASKEGIPSNQLHRMLGITLKSAWFMSHRIGEAMAPAKDAPRLGGKGKVVEADEMFLAKSRKTRSKGSYRSAPAVLTLHERGGRVRSFPLEGNPNRDNIIPELYANVDPARHAAH